MSQTQFAAASGGGATWLSETFREYEAFLAQPVSFLPSDLSRATGRFLERLPAPGTPLELLTQRALLANLAIHYGRAAHAAFHEQSGTPLDRCAFCPASSLNEWPGDLTNSPTGAFQHWADRFGPAFEEVHPLACAQAAKAHLVAHFREKIVISAVARALGCSPKYLQRTFKSLTGFTFRTYQEELRIAEALRLLTHSDMKVEAIAAEVGYRSKKDLYRVVKARVGCTPLAYRKGREDSRR